MKYRDARHVALDSFVPGKRRRGHDRESSRIEDGDRNIERSSQCLKFRDMSRHKRSSRKKLTSAIDYFNSMARPISGRLILAGIRNFRQI